MQIYIITFEMLDHVGCQQNGQQEQDNAMRNWREVNCLVICMLIKYLATFTANFSRSQLRLKERDFMRPFGPTKILLGTDFRDRQ